MRIGKTAKSIKFPDISSSHNGKTRVGLVFGVDTELATFSPL